jgi:hypothetical protein
MTQGIKELRSIRLKRETTPGVKVAPRFLWRGSGDMPEDAREVMEIEEQIGIIGGSNRTVIPRLAGQISFADTEATFEQLSDLLLAAGLGTTVAGGAYQGTMVGAGSSCFQELVFPSLQTFPVVSYTIEAGNNVEAEVLPYAIVTQFTLSGAGGEPLRYSADWSARYVDRTNDSGTFSVVGTIPDVETILASRGSIWLSDTPTNWGTGLVPAGNILSFEMSVESQWEWKYSVDSGTTYPYRAVLTSQGISGQFTFEHQIDGTFGMAGTAGVKQRWRDQVAQLMQVEFVGGTIADGSAGTASKKLLVRLPIKYLEIGGLDDQNGNDIVQASWVSRYNPTTPAAGRGTIQIIRRGTSEFSGA